MPQRVANVDFRVIAVMSYCEFQAFDLLKIGSIADIVALLG